MDEMKSQIKKYEEERKKILSGKLTETEKIKALVES